MEQLVLEPMTKECRGCGQLLPVDDFGASSKVKSGRLAQCRACAQARKRDHEHGAVAPAGHVRLARALADAGLDAEVACRVVAVWDRAASEGEPPLGRVTRPSDRRMAAFHYRRGSSKVPQRPRREKRDNPVTVRYDPSIVRPKLKLVEGGAGSVAPPTDKHPPAA